MTQQKDKLLADMKARHEYHKKLVEKKTCIFKWMGYIMILAIPIISAILTAMPQFGVAASVLSLSGLFLTILTIINSTLKPQDRFLSSTMQAIALEDWKTDLNRHLWELGDDEGKKFLALMERKDRELPEIGKSIADATLPTASPSTTGRDTLPGKPGASPK